MSGGQKAKPLGRPLDGGVRRQRESLPAMAAYFIATLGIEEMAKVPVPMAIRLPDSV
jgi:hypothetical protein